MPKKRKTVEQTIIEKVLNDSNVKIKTIDKGRDGNKFVIYSKGNKFFCKIKNKKNEPILPCQETEIIKKINSPYIVKPIFSDIVRNRYVLIRPFVEGQDLEEFLKKDKKLEEKEIKKLAMTLFEVSKSLSEIGAIHFDIKPANIILGKDGKYYLVDFGTAKFLDKLHNVKLHPGKAYIAPEVLRFLFDQTENNLQDISILSDMYSIGGVLYSVATRRNLSDFFKYSNDLLSLTPPPVRHYYPSFDPTLSDIIDKLISKEPSRRPHPNDLSKLLNGEILEFKSFPLYLLKTKPKGEHNQMLPVITEKQNPTGIYWVSDEDPNFSQKKPIYNVLWETPSREKDTDIDNDLVLQHKYGVIAFCVSGFELDVGYGMKILQKNIKQIIRAIKWKKNMSLEIPLLAVIPISKTLLKSEELKHIKTSYKSQELDGIILRICDQTNTLNLDEEELSSIKEFIEPWLESKKLILFDGDLSVLPLSLHGVGSFIASTYPKLNILQKYKIKPLMARKPDGMYISSLLTIVRPDTVTSLRGNRIGKSLTNCSCSACSKNLMQRNRLSKWERPERRQHFIFTIVKEIETIKKSSSEDFKNKILTAQTNASTQKFISIDQSHLKAWLKFLEKN